MGVLRVKATQMHVGKCLTLYHVLVANDQQVTEC